MLPCMSVDGRFGISVFGKIRVSITKRPVSAFIIPSILSIVAFILGPWSNLSLFTLTFQVFVSYNFEIGNRYITEEIGVGIASTMSD